MVICLQRGANDLYMVQLDGCSVIVVVVTDTSNMIQHCDLHAVGHLTITV